MSGADPHPSIVSSRGFTVVPQNGLDRSRDQVNGLHGGSECVVEYDDFDKFLISEVGCVVKVSL